MRAIGHTRTEPPKLKNGYVQDDGTCTGMLLFNEAISNLGLIDIPLKGRKYTWSNMQSSPLLQRLNWFFSSLSWTTSFPITMAEPLAMTTSYHVPCVISFQSSAQTADFQI
jgi:hypothetical protein